MGNTDSSMMTTTTTTIPEGEEDEEEDEPREESKVVVNSSNSTTIIPEGQAIIAELFQEAYDVIHQGLLSTDYYKIEDEELLPLHDKLDDYIVNFTRILQAQAVNKKGKNQNQFFQKDF